MGAKADLYKYVDRIREVYGLSNIDYGMDISDLRFIDPTIHVETHCFSTTGFGAAIFFGDKMDTIILNTQRNSQEQGFDFRHELLHKHKHRKNGKLSYNCFTTQQDSFIEWEANEGAAEMMIPYRIFISDVAEAYPTFMTSSDIHIFKRKMQQKYNVTPAMIELRLKNLKYEIWQCVNNVPMDEIEILSGKELEKRHIKVQSINDLKNQFWNEEFKRWKKSRSTFFTDSCQNIVL